MSPSSGAVPLSVSRPLARVSTVPAEGESAFFCENRRNRRHGFKQPIPAEGPASRPGKLGEEHLDAEGRRGLLAEGRGGRLRRDRPVLLRAIRGNGRPGRTVPESRPPSNPFKTQPRRATASARLSAPLCEQFLCGPLRLKLLSNRTGRGARAPRA